MTWSDVSKGGRATHLLSDLASIVSAEIKLLHDGTKVEGLHAVTKIAQAADYLNKDDGAGWGAQARSSTSALDTGADRFQGTSTAAPCKRPARRSANASLARSS